MKKFSFITVCLLLTFNQSFAHADEPQREPAWNKTINTDQGKYVVNMQSEEKKIEVKKVSDSSGTSPHLRVRIYRKAPLKPFEVNLSTLEQKNSPLNYTGKIDQWNESCVGLQLEFSFDKKKWKKLGEKLIP